MGSGTSRDSEYTCLSRHLSSLIKFYIYTVEGAYKHCLLNLCLDCILTCFSFEQFEDVALGRLFR